MDWTSYGPATDKLYEELREQREPMGALVKHHLALDEQDVCTVLPPHQWIRGSFIVCVFVNVNSGSSSRKVVFRCPVPHKLTEARYLDSIDEKLSCEISASIWMRENCPQIRGRLPRENGYQDAASSSIT